MQHVQFVSLQITLKITDAAKLLPKEKCIVTQIAHYVKEKKYTKDALVGNTALYDKTFN